MPGGEVPDVMGSSEWEPTTDQSGVDALLDYIGSAYEVIDGDIHSLQWPDKFTGTQSIEITVEHFMFDEGSHDPGSVDYVILYVRKDGTRAFPAANDRLEVELGRAESGDFYLQVTGEPFYTYFESLTSLAHLTEFTFRLESDVDGTYRIYVDDSLIYTDVYPDVFVGPSNVALAMVSDSTPTDSPRITDISIRSSDLDDEGGGASFVSRTFGTEISIDLCVDWMRVAECVDGVFDGVIRNLVAGEWRLTGAVEALAFAAGYELADINTIRVVEGATIIFAGYVTPVTGGVGGLQVVKDASGDIFTLTGPDAWDVLASRVAYPTPATEPPWADAWDLRTGQASTAAAGYILANAGVSAIAARQIPGLTVVDTGAGASGSWSARLQPLDQLITRVCRDGGIVCLIVVGYSGDVQITLRAPVDRRSTRVLSDQGDLTRIEIITVPESATFVIAGGQGSLASRTFATAGTATGAARRETFSDQSSLSTAPEVQQSADTKLALAAQVLTVRAQVGDVAATRLRYLIDYDIGDTISVEIDDVRYPVVVESVTVHVSPERVAIRPVLGDAVPNLVTGLIRDVANLASRFDTQIA